MYNSYLFRIMYVFMYLKCYTLTSACSYAGSDMQKNLYAEAEVDAEKPGYAEEPVRSTDSVSARLLVSLTLPLLLPLPLLFLRETAPAPAPVSASVSAPVPLLLFHLFAFTSKVLLLLFASYSYFCLLNHSTFTSFSSITSTCTCTCTSTCHVPKLRLHVVLLPLLLNSGDDSNRGLDS